MKNLILLLWLIPGLFSTSLAQNDPSATVGDTGTVSFIYKNGPVTYITVRAADGKIWLQENLGALKPPSFLLDSAAYGDLFQWGRWDDEGQFRYSDTRPTNTSLRSRRIENDRHQFAGHHRAGA